jgi:membrane protease YdiL (CAAX protease family)
MTSRTVERPLGSNTGPTSSNPGLWRVIAAVEVVLATAAVLLDLGIPTLVLVALAVLSLIARRQRAGSLGLRRPARPVRMAAQVFGLSLLWTALTLAMIMPAVEHLTGQRRDISQFAPLEGNLSLLLYMLLISWTLAAFGEEFAYRGYVQTRMRDVLPAGRTGLVLAVLLSSMLFGLAHTEQGIVGVVLSGIDAIFFSIMRYRYQTLWAAILAHGFLNSIGIIAYFIAGPFYGLW